MKLNASRILQIIIVLAIAGVVVSSISLHHHYSNSSSSFCDFGGSFNCDIVNRSIYSTAFGFPVALIGVWGYVGVALLAVAGLRGVDVKKLLTGASILGSSFALHLTYIEGFVLAAWCVLCLSSLAIILSITVLVMIFAARSRQSN
jgi:uncharacterized membrane protein